MIPAFANLALSFLNGSALLGLLQVGELMTVAAKISDYTFKPIEIMSAVGLVYLLLNLLVARLARGIARDSASPTRRWFRREPAASVGRDLPLPESAAGRH